MWVCFHQILVDNLLRFCRGDDSNIFVDSASVYPLSIFAFPNIDMYKHLIYQKCFSVSLLLKGSYVIQFMKYRISLQFKCFVVL